MSEAPPGAGAAEDAPPAEEAADPVARWGEDAASGRKFVRWNAVTLVLGLVCLGAGWAARHALSGPPLPARPPLVEGAAWAAPEVARYEGVLRRAGEERPATLVRRIEPGVEGETLRVFAAWTPVEGAPARVTCRVAASDPRRLRGARALRGDAVVRLTSTGVGWLRAVGDGSGAGDSVRRLEAGWLEDHLPLLVRAVDWEAVAEVEVRLLPSLLLEGDGGGLDVVLSADAPAELSAPAGSFTCRRVIVRAGREIRGEYWVGVGEARPLVAFDDPTGRARLATRRRGDRPK